MLTVYWWSILTTGLVFFFLFFFHRCCFLWISPGMCLELTVLYSFPASWVDWEVFFVPDSSLFLPFFSRTTRMGKIHFSRQTNSITITFSVMWNSSKPDQPGNWTISGSLDGTQHPISGTSCLEYSIIGDNSWSTYKQTKKEVDSQ